MRACHAKTSGSLADPAGQLCGGVVGLLFSIPSSSHFSPRRRRFQYPASYKYGPSAAPADRFRRVVTPTSSRCQATPVSLVGRVTRLGIDCSTRGVVIWGLMFKVHVPGNEDPDHEIGGGSGALSPGFSEDIRTVPVLGAAQGRGRPILVFGPYPERGTLEMHENKRGQI